MEIKESVSLKTFHLKLSLEKQKENTVNRTHSRYGIPQAIYIYLRIPVGRKKERKKGAESLFKEIITEKFPNLGR